MKEIKPKKERKFLKAMGDIALTLFRELVLGIGKKVINKVGNKRQGLVITSIILASSFAIAQFPNTTNKQRLGFQTTADGLVWRGSISDTASIQPVNNQNAWVILDTVNLKLYSFDFTSNVWNLISSAGGGLTMPFDSITFNTAKNGTVGVGEVEYNDTQGSLIQGLKGGNVTNVIGQQLHQRVNNRTGAPLAKGDVVYLSGSQGNRITVAKGLAVTDAFSANTFGVVAESIADNQSGFIITEGLITGLNTSALTEDSAVYLSPTVPGALTSTKPQAPQHTVYIGVCVKSNNGSGELFVKIRNGQELDELHDTRISNPVTGATLYYLGGLWRDTTAALLVSDTAAMLANYSLKGYVDSIAQNFQDSIDEITNGYFKQEFPTVTKDTLNWTKPVQLPVGGSNLLLVYRNGQMINDAQYSVIDTNKVKINSGSYKLGENYTVVYVKGGGGSGSGGVPFDTSVLNLQARLDLKLNISDTAAMLANYATKAYADTTGRFYARQDFTNVSSSTLTWTQSDTLITGGVNVVQVYRNGQILLPSQYTIPSSTSVVIAATSYKAGENYTVIFPRGGGAGSGGGSGSLTSISAGTGITVSPNPITTTGTVSADLSVLMELSDTVSLSNRINLKLNATDTASLSNRINSKLNISDTLSMLSPYFRDADTTSLNLTSRFAAKQNTLTLTTTGTSGAATLIGATLNIPQYSGGGGSGTVTSVATGYGINGGPITTTGTLVLDSSTVYNYIRDSIVDVQIGNDTIKILKQEYNNVTSDTLTWTITSKFPIQLRAYILLFRNGQLLINDQYSVIDTNKVKINSGSYKLGENYTVVTVSGIGSAGISQTGNLVYPEAGIALSTGTTWTTSIPNNSTNWNTAYTDRLKWDGGSSGLVAATGRTSLGGTTIGQSMFTLTNPSALTFPQFNADNTVTALSASSFRGAIGAGTVSSVTASGTAGNPLSITNTTTTPTIELLSATTGRNGYLTSTDWTTFNNKQSQLSGTGFVKASGTSITYDNSTYLRTGLADSTYLKLTGGTLTGGLTGTTGTFNSLKLSTSGNNLFTGNGILTDFSNIAGIKFYDGVLGNMTIFNRSISTTFGSIIFSTGNTLDDGSGLPFERMRITHEGNVNINNNFTVGGTLNATGATTLGSTLAVTGATTLSTTSATPTSLLGKDGSGVVGAVTLGSGLTLSSGTLTASGATGVTSVTATIPLSSSGGSTPNITITDASTTTSGVITTGTQSIAGAKTFTAATVINGGLTVNEDGSNVGVFRVEGDNNISLIQTAPASDYVGIGRAPENSFDVQGAVRFRTLTLNGTPTRIIGADATGDINQITLGTGLSLSSGTLSATGGTGTVTNVTGTLPISVANGTTTPSITIADAGTGASGVVNTTTQSFAGNKTFTGTVTLNSATGTATSVIGRSSTGQVVGVSLNTGLGISGGSLSLDFKTVLTIGTDFPSTNAQSSSDLTFTVTGASVGQPVLLGVPDGSAPANTNYTAWVSATNTVKIRFNNYSASTVNPAAGDFTIRVFNL